MKRSEFIAIEDHAVFMDLLRRCTLSQQKKALAIQDRWAYLYNQYRPDASHVNAKRDYLKKGGGRSA